MSQGERSPVANIDRMLNGRTLYSYWHAADLEPARAPLV